MNNYSITITQKAYSSITECVLFVNNVSSDAANHLYEEMMNAIRSLSSFPNKYPEVPGLLIRDIKVRKMPIHDGRYVILYKVENDNVVIYDIIDMRKDNILMKIF